MKLLPWKQFAKRLYRWARRARMNLADAHHQLDSHGVPRRWPRGDEDATLGWRIRVLFDILTKPGHPHTYSHLAHFREHAGQPGHAVNGVFIEGISRVVMCTCGARSEFPLVQEMVSQH